jgi:hypothetical protein
VPHQHQQQLQLQQQQQQQQHLHSRVDASHGGTPIVTADQVRDWHHTLCSVLAVAAF